MSTHRSTRTPLRPDQKNTRPSFLSRRFRSVALWLLLALVYVALLSGPGTRTRTARAADAQQTSNVEMQFGPSLKLGSGEQRIISPQDEADLATAMSTSAPRSQRLRQPQMARVPDSPVAYLVLNVEFDSAASLARFSIPGVTVFAHKDKFADVFVEPKQSVMDQLRKAPGIVWVEQSAAIEVPPPPVRPRTLERVRGEEKGEEIVRGGLDGVTGKGTIIAVLDSGLDFRNPDFITYDAAGRPSSRLLYLWDTTSADYDSRQLGGKPPLSYPNRASIGTLYTRAQLTAALRLEKSGRSSVIPACDLNGHGTACAGVAAGNGNNGKGADGAKRPEVIGVAPDADIIAVRISDESTPYIKNMFLLNAICEWLDSVAGARPLVVSCSFGGHRGGHDGYRIEERQLDARFPLNRQGRAIVIAAGNEALNEFHSAVSFADLNNSGVVTWQAEKSGAKLEIYFESGDLDDLDYASVKGMRIDASAYLNPLTKKPVAEAKVPPGRGGLALFDNSGRRLKADIYISGGQFDADVASAARQVSTPGTANNAITVGSYDWNRVFDYQGRQFLLRDVMHREMQIGQLSAYSNPGFSRNGTVKPEIVAPGEYYYASFAKLLDHSGVHTYNATTNPTGNAPDSSGNYMLFNGTSAATPYVAGVVSLMFQQKPTLTFGQVRELLTHNASQDGYTGSLPNPAWGYGKLDLKAIRKILAALKSQQ